MDAKERYRLRRQLRSALTRMVLVCGDLIVKRVQPDQQTALMVGDGIRLLVTLAQEANLDLDQCLHNPAYELHADYFSDTTKSRQRETSKRKKRRFKQRLRAHAAAFARRAPPPPA